MGLAKAVSAAILEEDIPLCSQFSLPAPLPEGTFAGESGPLGVFIGWRTKAHFARTLRLIPRVLRVGVGCRRGISAEVSVVFADALKADLPAICAETLGERPWKVCANLPYNVTTPLITAFLEAGCFESVTVMIQKEVAQRLCAAPGTGEYGAFSVLVQWYAEPKLFFDVPPHCFVPQPKVTSAVVRMDRRAAPPASVDDEKLFFRTVRAAFAQRRKTLSNALRSGFSELDRAAIESAMEETGLPPAVRGETLSIAQFAALSNALLRKFDK